MFANLFFNESDGFGKDFHEEKPIKTLPTFEFKIWDKYFFIVSCSYLLNINFLIVSYTFPWIELFRKLSIVFKQLYF